MSDKKKVIPKKGLIIPKADGNGNLQPDGEVLTMNSYYWGLKNDGDVTLEDVPVEKPAGAPPAAGEGAAPAAEVGTQTQRKK
jgi:hypothetical protein